MNPGGGAAAFGAGILIFQLGFLLLSYALTAAGLWRVFEKAGQPGWAALIPIYNLIVLLQITDKPVWWVILCFIPCLNIIAGLYITIVVSIELANRFRAGAGFAVGLILLPFIFYPILGFGSAEYEGGRGRGSRKRKKRRPVRDIEEEEEGFEEEPAPRAKKRRPTEDIDEEEDLEDEPPPRARARQRPREDTDEDIQEVERPRENITPARPKPPAAPPAAIRCPSCGTTLRPPAGAAGKRAKCPKCQSVFVVPGGPGPANDDG